MGSTYLDLTNRVLRRLNEVEIQSSDFLTVRGVHAAAKDAVLDAVREINTQKFEWPFNAAQGTQVLTVGTPQPYTWPTDLRIADWESFYVLKDSLNNNTKELTTIHRDEWYHENRQNDLDAGVAGRNIPDFVFETDNGGFGVTPSPNKLYTVKFRYFIKTITLTAATDVCTIPTEYDYVIVYKALSHLYMFLDNDERTKKIEQNYAEALSTMTYVLIPKAYKFTDTRVNF